MIDHAKIYSVKSNARRDARKAGLAPDLVVRDGAGWRISAPAPAPAETPLVSKRSRLRAMLMSETGATAAALQEAFGWLPHTLRGAISTLAKRDGLAVICERRDGQAVYRIAGERAPS